MSLGLYTKHEENAMQYSSGKGYTAIASVQLQKEYTNLCRELEIEAEDIPPSELPSAISLARQDLDILNAGNSNRTRCSRRI